jgi:hypothetical protein
MPRGSPSKKTGSSKQKRAVIDVSDTELTPDLDSSDFVLHCRLSYEKDFANLGDKSLDSLKEPGSMLDDEIVGGLFW